MAARSGGARKTHRRAGNPEDSRPAFACDVGNTRVKLFRLPRSPWPEGRRPSRRWVAGSLALAIPKDEPGKTAALLRRRIGTAAARLHVVSVDPAWSSACVEALAAKGIETCSWRNADLPIAHPYRQPHRLGSDRLLAAMAARWLLPDGDRIVVDAGTAVTVDLVTSDGRFAGGAIAPGLDCLAAALARAGAKLVEIDPRRSAAYPGRSTRKALALGVGAAFEGGVSRLVEAALARCPGARVVVTGGDGARAAAALAPQRPLHVPELLAIGLALLEHPGR